MWDTALRFWLIIICFFVALIPRFVPLSFFRKRKIPKWFNEWMNYVPISLFTALVVKELLITRTYSFSLSGKGPDLVATLLVILVASWTRSMALSVILGLVMVSLLSLII